MFKFVLWDCFIELETNLFRERLENKGRLKRPEEERIGSSVQGWSAGADGEPGHAGEGGAGDPEVRTGENLDPAGDCQGSGSNRERFPEPAGRLFHARLRGSGDHCPTPGRFCLRSPVPRNISE